MGRVERRRYQYRRRRAAWLRRGMLLTLLLIGAALVWKYRPYGAFQAEGMNLLEETKGSGFDRTKETREVMLEETIWYAIQTGVFSAEEGALAKADAYTERGAPGVVVHQGEKWRVFIACYGTQDAAGAVRSRLQSNQKVDTYLYEWVCPQVRLRLTGMAGQLDAAEAGFTLLNTAAVTLRDTAIELDAAQLTTQETASVVEDLNSRIGLWEETVHDRFGRNPPALVESMLALTDNWPAVYARLQAAEGPIPLSAALKAEAMAWFERNVAWRNMLLAP